MMRGPKEVLALLSGKGGSGKTVLGLAMSRILSDAGRKVLLVDCDIATHGATYFFEPEIPDGAHGVLSLYDFRSTDSGASPAKEPLKTRSGFQFIPSTLDPANEAAAWHSAPDSPDVLKRLLARFSDLDVVIFDCQAGYSPLAEQAASLAQRNLIVLEPDAVSSAALRVLFLRMQQILKTTNTFQIFNKLTEEEIPVYEQVSGGTLFTNLPPVPFDWQVRAAFAVRRIPTVTTQSSAFGLGVLRIMQTLFPSTAEDLAHLEKETVGNWHEDLRTKLGELESQHRRIKYQQIESQRQRRLQRTTLVSTALASVGLFVTASSAVGELLPISVALAAVGIFIAAASLILNRYTRLGIHAEREQDLAQESLAQIEAEVDRYRTLLTTDPRLREYARSTGGTSRRVPQGGVSRPTTAPGAGSPNG